MAEMKDMLEALVGLITDDTTLSGLVGTRVYPLVIPLDAARPACCYQVITTQRGYNQDSQSSFTGARVQITMDADSYEQAKTLAEAMRKCLSGYRGTIGTLVFHGIFLENEYDGYSFETEIKAVRQDYRMNFRE